MRILSLQGLRAVAASAVVYVHATQLAQQNTGQHVALPERIVTLGNAGVDVFFVLSGFLMAYLHQQDFGKGRAGQFLSKRLTRIVPIYWLLMAFAVALALFLPSLFSTQRSMEWPWLLGSFLFAPIPDSSGDYTRPLIVGWTLDFEMHFYVLFTLALLFRRGLIALTCTMLGLVALGFAVSFGHPWLRLLTDPMLLEFLAGIGIAMMVRRVKLPRIAGAALIAVALALLLSFTTGPRYLRAGIPAALLVAGVLYAQMRCESPVGRLMAVLGDASYSTYLVQVFTLPAGVVALRLAGIQLPADVYALVLTAGTIVASLVCWKVVERPLTKAAKSLLARPAAQPVVTPA